MKLNKTDYVLERASDGGYYAWLTVNMQCNAYGESPDEAIQNLPPYTFHQLSHSLILPGSE